MKPKGKEWDFLYLWLGRVTKWPRIKWGPQFNQVAKDTCGSGLVTSEVLSEHLVWVSPLIAPTPPTFRSYQGSWTAPHPLSTFTAFIHSILRLLPHHWLPQGWARPTWCEGRWCSDRKVEVLPSGEGARVRGEPCKHSCPLIRCRAKPKTAQHSVRGWNKAGTALHSLAGYTDFRLQQYPPQGLSASLSRSTSQHRQQVRKLLYGSTW